MRLALLRIAAAGMLLHHPATGGVQPAIPQFRALVLQAHNAERLRLGVPALRWDDRLAAGAQSWADHLARTGRFEHSPDGPGQERLGENIWGGTPHSYAPEAMVGLWIEEKRYFKPGTFPHNSVTGRVTDVSHYTQLVWRTTAQVGCARSVGRSEEIMVCRYSRPGNLLGSSAL